MLKLQGYYNPTAGSNVYYACGAGTYASTSGSSACSLVPTGYYMPFAGFVNSWPCSTSLQAGAVTCNTGGWVGGWVGRWVGAAATSTIELYNTVFYKYEWHLCRHITHQVLAWCARLASTSVDPAV